MTQRKRGRPFLADTRPDKVRADQVICRTIHTLNLWGWSLPYIGENIRKLRVESLLTKSIVKDRLSDIKNDQLTKIYKEWLRGHEASTAEEFGKLIEYWNRHYEAFQAGDTNTMDSLVSTWPEFESLRRREGVVKEFLESRRPKGIDFSTAASRLLDNNGLWPDNLKSSSAKRKAMRDSSYWVHHQEDWPMTPAHQPKIYLQKTG